MTIFRKILGRSAEPALSADSAEKASAEVRKTMDIKGQIRAIHKSQAVIEFNMDGTIITANDNFLNAVGYSLPEIQGQHHSMFATPEYGASAEYRAFWAALNRGEYDAGEYKRLGKGGKEIWIQASYNPILDIEGKPFKVVKYATDITAQKLQNADFSGQIDAIGKSQAVIEFNMDGTIITANDNFLGAVGYSLPEIQGQHHSMFATPEYGASAEYRAFWAALNRGEYDAGEYKRLGKGGKEIWIQASYNPILDAEGKPFKVVKYATDITAQKLQNADFSGQINAIGKSQAVIEFNMDGTIITANDNFLGAVGYSLPEIQGQHHSMFATPEYGASAEYREFWAALNRGEYDAGEYKRLGKGGKEIWIQASYNPILDAEGKPFKVVKYATDITDRKQTFEKIKDILEQLSAGDLSVKLDVAADSEFVELSDSINGFTDQLAAIVKNIQQASGSVSVASNEISQGNMNLSQRTEEQAASLEQTAASMEEITGTIQQNTDNARQANVLARTSRETAESGGEVVGRAIEAMSQISDSSKKIADIISVINEIAFQTNLLALNASVEAARAGEQGRGFAVVAGEVRNLAGRSATAAKEIKELIEDSANKVGEGSELVNQSGEALQEIVTSAKKVSDIVAEITAASDEQSTGIAEINTAITQMDEMTQQNAALVEQVAAASESMGEQASDLESQIKFFRIEDMAEPAPTQAVFQPPAKERRSKGQGVG